MHNLTQFESVFFFLIFDITGGVASVGSTPVGVIWSLDAWIRGISPV